MIKDPISYAYSQRRNALGTGIGRDENLVFDKIDKIDSFHASSTLIIRLRLMKNHRLMAHLLVGKW